MPTPKWFRQAKPTCSIVPIRRFVTDSVFALKNGGYGCMFALDGIDDEGLTDEIVEDAMRRVQGALKSLPEHGRLYQYARIRKGFDIPRREHYSNPRVETVITDRIEFLNETANFRRIELFWVVTVEPPKKNGFGSKAFSPQQFGRQTSRSVAQTERTAEMLTVQLEDLLGLRLLRQDEAVSFWAYLLNLEPWALGTKLASRERVDTQLVRSSIQWTDEHLRIGKQYAQFFSLLDNPGGSRPNLFGALQSIDANIILCSQWIPRTRNDVQKRISQLEGFAGVFRHRLLAVAANMRSPQNLEKSVRAKAADKGSDKLADVLNSIDNEGHDFGEYSFFGLVHSRDQQEVLEAMPLVIKALVDIQAPATEETQGSLSAYYAMLPGNSSGDAASNFNVRLSWLRDDHNARMAMVFAPSIGSTRSDDLDHEYLTVYETRTKTPYFLDPYTEGMRTTLVVGAPRSGKSVNGNNIILHEQKYGGFTFVIDVGGSYESTIRLFDGVVERVGTSGPRINPFSLEPTEPNLSFLFQFIRLLLVKGGATLSPEDEDAIDKSIRRMYLLAPTVRRLKNMALAPHLQRYLTKWTEGGAYGKVFDNIHDSLRLARIQSFDFQDVTENEQDLIEPMLFWILRQINQVIYDPANLAYPKHILFDELWKHLKTRTLLESAINSLKSGGKHLAGVTLLTQAAQDLGENTAIIVNACTTQLFLPDRTFDRALYQRLFNLNDQEVANLASLAPREAMLKRAGYSKVLKLSLDPRSYWLFSTKPKDRQRRAQEIAEHGYDRAFELQSA
ncbi:MAG: VirB4 family type IV secretion system protein [Bryobacteraceae bacterium]